MLRMSSLFLRTLREDPSDAEVPSHRLLVRGGYIRRWAPGIYSLLPLGQLVHDNVARIVHEEMQAIGAQQVHVPIAAGGEDAEPGMPCGAFAAAIPRSFDFELGAGLENRRLLGEEWS